MEGSAKMGKRKKRREEGMGETQRGQERSRKKRIVTAGLVLAMAVSFAGLGYVVFRKLSPGGYRDYTVQKEQYYVEYSEEYDYGEVITVEYPVLTGIDSVIQEQMNAQMYETAMDRVNYWHFHPSEAQP